MSEWQPISEAQTIACGTIADLKMASGRTYRAVWAYRGRCCAWWPESKARKKPIGLYNPVEFKIIGTMPEWVASSGLKAAPRSSPYIETKEN